MTACSRGARLAWLLVVCASAAGAQTLPSEPIALAGGRVTIGGDISASYGSDDTGFFNYTDYEHSALRLLRIDLSAAAKLSPHFTLLGEVRTENLGRVRPYAFYLRIKPWTARDFDIQVGRVPPTFRCGPTRSPPTPTSCSTNGAAAGGCAIRLAIQTPTAAFRS